MTVKELIEELSKLNQEQNIYLGASDYEENYYYDPLGVTENEVEGEKIVVIYYRN